MPAPTAGRRPVDKFLARLNATERNMDLPNRRPVDAATLLVIDGTGPDARVMMGRRRRDLAFMPGLFVFPGGRVDPGDSRTQVAGELDPAVLSHLMKSMRQPRGEARARAIAVAAVRETYEEAGLLIGSPGKSPSSPAWDAFRTRGLAPDLSAIRFIARAITPPRRPRRFDTRFLAVPAAAIADRLERGVGPDEEFEEVLWISLAEARALKLPPITLTILDELLARLESDPKLDPATSVPFYHWRPAGFVRELI